MGGVKHPDIIYSIIKDTKMISEDFLRNINGYQEEEGNYDRLMKHDRAL